MNGYRVFFASALLLALSAGTAAARSVWAASPYDNNGLNVTPKEIDYRSGKLWFKLNFVNNSDKEMTVNPDQIQCRLPDGRTVTRVKGMFDKLKHGAVVIPPGAGEMIAMEYLTQQEPKKATLAFGNGFSVGGKPTRFPDFVARPSDAEWGASDYNHKKIRVSVVSAQLNKDVFEVTLKFLNDQDGPVVLDTDNFKAKVEGATHDREKGLKDKFSKQAIVMAPHTAEEISLSFQVGNPGKVAITMAGVAGNSLGLPDLVIEPK
jgi:NAD(P)H-hydrate repair Nnr-like enzyme with NAD(P)H-hydrate dehydratase domain